MRITNQVVLTAAAFATCLAAGGCASTRRNATAMASQPAPDAIIHVSGLACPYCVYNVERSLLAVPGVRRVETDLNSGVVRAWLETGANVQPQALWEAVKKSGFTPASLILGGRRYEGL